ncbi:DNA adenine methylase [Tissierella praeacuta DSM 18095]|uniref:site-specific DNA-methyltransferase (adenine-specific) n=1 Tax=Tissierella praeacuta DSM 18095 TaxID=1123404 RepID=A0A1M4ZBF2_9FIRM|nr:DNA adenine methylase [Tissierella praeacuta]TCU74246.1 DNA adenine methylase [Tissierella praeacuta]SHF15137.1 DNA adenine methylase [Tissierella praeacuta DSM 18095]SUO99529.1 Modification methylase DpnIIA [Tissierella praeacuta]
MLKPPICRMGGKSKLRKTIIDMIPTHVCYVELFFGAGWVYFGKELSKVEVINDIDKELINLFKMIKYHAPEIERMLDYQISSRDMFEEYKNYTIDYLTEINRAVRFLYLITQSFAGKGQHYGYGTTKIPSQQIFYKNLLMDLKDRLRNTYVENLSFETIIDKYDREHTFFFADPPYFETTGYSDEFGEKHHLLLRDKLINLKGKFLLTINDHESTRKWYKDFNIKEKEVAYSVAKDMEARKKYKELIITNY